jgi:histidine triad (HIT) family protein
MTEANCIFCRIVSRAAPASFVYEDDLVAAFIDTMPLNAGHTLVVPKRHAAYLSELQPEESGPIFEAGRRVAASLRESGLRCDGVNFHLADGAAAGQEIFHLHLHVIPRWKGDGAGLRRPPSYGSRPPRSELDVIARVLKEHLPRD